MVKKRVHQEYKAMIQRTPGIGGNTNSLEADLIGACFFFSLAKADPQMTPERMNTLISQGIHSSLMQKLHEGKKKKGTLFSEQTQNKKAAEAERSQQSSYEMDWKFTFKKGHNEYYCTYTACGICKLAHREHMEAFLPCMCQLDYAAYEMVGAKLVRSQTLASGGTCCDFHLIRQV